MDLWMLDDRAWEFSRCPMTGRVSLWPRENPPIHCIGGEGIPAETPEAGWERLVPPVPVIWARLRAQERPGLRAVAVVGEVAAGPYDVTVAYTFSRDVQEGDCGNLVLPRECAFPGAFALRVRGDSMRDLGILDGDFVLVRPQQAVQNGDLVIAALADSADPEGYVTLKRYYKEAGRIRLQPANPAFAPIHLYPEGELDPVVILGKVVAIARPCNTDA